MKLQPLMTWGQVKAALEANGLNDDMHVQFIYINKPRDADDMLVTTTSLGVGVIDSSDLLPEDL